MGCWGVGLMGCWVVGLMVGWLAGWLVGWVAGWLAGWLGGCVVRWWGGGWVVGWLGGHSTRQASRLQYLEGGAKDDVPVACTATVPTEQRAADRGGVIGWSGKVSLS